MTSQLLDQQLLEDVQIEDNHPGKEIINVDLEIKEIHRPEKIWMIIIINGKVITNSIIGVKIIVVNPHHRWSQVK